MLLLLRSSGCSSQSKWEVQTDGLRKTINARICSAAAAAVGTSSRTGDGCIMVVGISGQQVKQIVVA